MQYQIPGLLVKHSFNFIDAVVEFPGIRFHVIQYFKSIHF